jgi:hypothetical protein
MTANRKQALTVFAVILAAFYALQWFGAFESWTFRVEGFVGLLALMPLFLVAGVVWFGMEMLSSLRRIEAALQADPRVEAEFIHGS